MLSNHMTKTYFLMLVLRVAVDHISPAMDVRLECVPSAFTSPRPQLQCNKRGGGTLSSTSSLTHTHANPSAHISHLWWKCLARDDWGNMDTNKMLIPSAPQVGGLSVPTVQPSVAPHPPGETQRCCRLTLGVQQRRGPPSGSPLFAVRTLFI